jgi:polar amino acid transport system substrate-binding protein
VGQLDWTEGGDDFGFVLPKGSALTAPVSAAVDQLREDGTLAEIAGQWLSDSIHVPVLK